MTAGADRIYESRQAAAIRGHISRNATTLTYALTAQCLGTTLQVCPYVGLAEYSLVGAPRRLDDIRFPQRAILGAVVLRRVKRRSRAHSIDPSSLCQLIVLLAR